MSEDDKNGGPGVRSSETGRVESVKRHRVEREILERMADMNAYSQIRHVTGSGMRTRRRSRAVGLLLALTVTALVVLLIWKPWIQGARIPFQQIIADSQANRIESITIYPDRISSRYRDGTVAYTGTYGRDNAVIALFSSLSSMSEIPEIRFSRPLFSDSIPFALSAILAGETVLLGLWAILRVPVTSGAERASLSFGRSRARMFIGDQPTVSFEEIGGCQAAKEAMEEIVQFLREPEIFVALGARPPRGILLSGPSGCGKTLLAKALCGEVGFPFFYTSASEFTELQLGVGASRVRDLFDQAKRHSPCLVFIDRMEAMGMRSQLSSTRVSESVTVDIGGKIADLEDRIQALDQLLVELDGFDTDTNVIVITETDRPDLVEPSLLRAGRMDRHVTVGKPNEGERVDILKIHIKGKPLHPDVDLAALAQWAEDCSGADISRWVNEAAIAAGMSGGKSIGMEHFKKALPATRSSTP